MACSQCCCLLGFPASSIANAGVSLLLVYVLYWCFIAGILLPLLLQFSGFLPAGAHWFCLHFLGLFLLRCWFIGCCCWLVQWFAAELFLLFGGCGLLGSMAWHGLTVVILQFSFVTACFVIVDVAVLASGVVVAAGLLFGCLCSSCCFAAAVFYLAGFAQATVPLGYLCCCVAASWLWDAVLFARLF